MKKLRGIFVTLLLLSACMSEARQSGDYTDDWSSAIQNDVCIIHGVPQILSASPYFSYDEPHVTYMRKNGDVVLWVPQPVHLTSTMYFIKLAAGVCPQ